MGARARHAGSGGESARMAAAAAMTAAGCGGAGAARSLSRFRGCLAGALLGDCVGAVYEARDTVDLTSVLRQVQDLEPDPGSPGSARTGGRGRAPRAPGARRGTRAGRGPLPEEPGLHDAGIPRTRRVQDPSPVFTYLAPNVRRLGARHA